MSSSKPTEIATELQELRLRGGHRVEIVSREESAILRLRSDGAGEGLEIEIAWTPQGPVARVRAGRIDLQTTSDVSLQCNSFAIEATQGISLRAQGNIAASGAAVAVEAREGRVVARANDDVQLLGEQILLNCDRRPEIPQWVKQGPDPMSEWVALAEATGDDELIADLRGEKDKGDASR